MKLDDVDLPSEEAAHHILKDDNEARIEALKQRTGGQIQLDGAFTMMQLATYVKHLCVEMGILDRADLDYENQRSQALDRVVAEVDEREEKMRAAKAMADLMRAGPSGPDSPRLRHVSF